MSENSTSRKMLSLVLLIAGAAGLVAALVMDFSGSENPIRGALLLLGAIVFFGRAVFYPDGGTSSQHY